LMSVLAIKPPPDLIEVLYAIEPRSFERARRVKTAMDLLRSGMPRAAVSVEIQRRYGISQPQAWRVVDMAFDMVGET
jgi:hypothetical protein